VKTLPPATAVGVDNKYCLNKEQSIVQRHIPKPHHSQWGLCKNNKRMNPNNTYYKLITQLKYSTFINNSRSDAVSWAMEVYPA